MIANLLIEAGKNTPKVNGNPGEGLLKFDGNSFPENVRLFYDPIMDWVSEVRKTSTKLFIDSKFYYMASSSVIAFLRVLKKAESLFGKENIEITWRYEEGDDDIKKIGEDYQHLIEIPFRFVEEEDTDD